ncbi:EndoU domain-containing protein [Streptomyces canus]|uniref:EndoU domain-containing protein n=1 Tax=Streptomyces canus TaxID=58343 RepID=UPI0027D87149|nr:EndoU domain-containing protein [Streptomyces canus]
MRQPAASGERDQVGYAWAWHRGETLGQDTIRLTRRVHLVALEGVGAEQVTAYQDGVSRGLEEVVNGREPRLPVLQHDEVTGPRRPDPLLRLRVEWVDSPEQADTVVQLHGGSPDQGQMRQRNWYIGAGPAGAVHELFHGYGPLDDESDDRVLLTPVTRAEQELGPDEYSAMADPRKAAGKRIVLTSDHLRQIAAVLTPYLGRVAPGEYLRKAGLFGDESRAADVDPAMDHRAEPAGQAQDEAGDGAGDGWHEAADFAQSVGLDGMLDEASAGEEETDGQPPAKKQRRDDADGERSGEQEFGEHEVNLSAAEFGLPSSPDSRAVSPSERSGEQEFGEHEVDPWAAEFGLPSSPDSRAVSPSERSGTAEEESGWDFGAERAGSPAEWSAVDGAALAAGAVDGLRGPAFGGGQAEPGSGRDEGVRGQDAGVSGAGVESVDGAVPNLADLLPDQIGEFARGLDGVEDSGVELAGSQAERSGVDGAGAVEREPAALPSRDGASAEQQLPENRFAGPFLSESDGALDGDGLARPVAADPAADGTRFVDAGVESGDGAVPNLAELLPEPASEAEPARPDLDVPHMLIPAAVAEHRDAEPRAVSGPAEQKRLRERLKSLKEDLGLEPDYAVGEALGASYSTASTWKRPGSVVGSEYARRINELYALVEEAKGRPGFDPKALLAAWQARPENRVPVGAGGTARSGPDDAAPKILLKLIQRELGGGYGAVARKLSAGWERVDAALVRGWIRGGVKGGAPNAEQISRIRVVAVEVVGSDKLEKYQKTRTQLEALTRAHGTHARAATLLEVLPHTVSRLLRGTHLVDGELAARIDAEFGRLPVEARGEAPAGAGGAGGAGGPRSVSGTAGGAAGVLGKRRRSPDELDQIDEFVRGLELAEVESGWDFGAERAVSPAERSGVDGAALAAGAVDGLRGPAFGGGQAEPGSGRDEGVRGQDAGVSGAGVESVGGAVPHPAELPAEPDEPDPIGEFARGLDLAEVESGWDSGVERAGSPAERSAVDGAGAVDREPAASPPRDGAPAEQQLPENRFAGPSLSESDGALDGDGPARPVAAADGTRFVDAGVESGGGPVPHPAELPAEQERLRERLASLREDLQLKSDKAVARALGASQSTMLIWRRGSVVGSEYARRINGLYALVEEAKGRPAGFDPEALLAEWRARPENRAPVGPGGTVRSGPGGMVRSGLDDAAAGRASESLSYKILLKLMQRELGARPGYGAVAASLSAGWERVDEALVRGWIRGGVKGGTPNPEQISRIRAVADEVIGSDKLEKYQKTLNQLKALTRALGQERAAEKLKVFKSTVSRWLRGTRLWDDEHAARIDEEFGKLLVEARGEAPAGAEGAEGAEGAGGAGGAGGPRSVSGTAGGAAGVLGKRRRSPDELDQIDEFAHGPDWVEDSGVELAVSQAERSGVDGAALAAGAVDGLRGPAFGGGQAEPGSGRDEGVRGQDAGVSGAGVESVGGAVLHPADLPAEPDDQSDLHGSDFSLPLGDGSARPGEVTERSWGQSEEQDHAAGVPFAAGEVRSERWSPFGAGGVGSQAFEFAPVGPGMRKVERVFDGELVEFDAPWEVRRPDASGERIGVGYAWAWHRGETLGQDTIRLTRRVHVVALEGVGAEQVTALQGEVSRGLEEVVNGREPRLPVLQHDEVTGPRRPDPLLRLGVEWVDSPEQADTVVQLHGGSPDQGQMRQRNWYTGVGPVVYVHELLHGFGVRDDVADARVLLTPGGRAEQVLGEGESSVMDDPDRVAEGEEGLVVLTSDHLRQIAVVLTPYLGGVAPGEYVRKAGLFGDESRAADVDPAMDHSAELAGQAQGEAGDGDWDGLLGAADFARSVGLDGLFDEASAGEEETDGQPPAKKQRRDDADGERSGEQEFGEHEVNLSAAEFGLPSSPDSRAVSPSERSGTAEEEWANGWGWSGLSPSGTEDGAVDREPAAEGAEGAGGAGGPRSVSGTAGGAAGVLGKRRRSPDELVQIDEFAHGLDWVAQTAPASEAGDGATAPGQDAADAPPPVDEQMVHPAEGAHLVRDPMETGSTVEDQESEEDAGDLAPAVDYNIERQHVAEPEEAGRAASVRGASPAQDTGSEEGAGSESDATGQDNVSTRIEPAADERRSPGVGRSLPRRFPPAVAPQEGETAAVQQPRPAKEPPVGYPPVDEMVHETDRPFLERALVAGERVWLFGDADPEEVFTNGVRAPDPDSRTELWYWASNNPARTQFIATTRDFSRFRDKRYRWEIHSWLNSEPRGVNLNKVILIQKASSHHHLRATWRSAHDVSEITFTGSIDPQAFRSVYDSLKDRTGYWNRVTRTVDWYPGQLQSRDNPGAAGRPADAAAERQDDRPASVSSEAVASAAPEARSGWDGTEGGHVPGESVRLGDSEAEAPAAGPGTGDAAADLARERAGEESEEADGADAPTASDASQAPADDEASSGTVGPMPLVSTASSAPEDEMSAGADGQPGHNQRVFDVAPAAGHRTVHEMVHEEDRPFLVLVERERVWRFGDADPEEVFTNGVRAPDPDSRTELWFWAMTTSARTQFIGTTDNFDLWFRNKRYRWEIHPRLNFEPRGLHLDYTIAKQKAGSHLPATWRNTYDESEITFTGSIDPQAFRSVYDSLKDRTGYWNRVTRTVDWYPGQLQSRDNPGAAGRPADAAAERQDDRPASVSSEAVASVAPPAGSGWDGTEGGDVPVASVPLGEEAATGSDAPPVDHAAQAPADGESATAPQNRTTPRAAGTGGLGVVAEQVLLGLGQPDTDRRIADQPGADGASQADYRGRPAQDHADQAEPEGDDTPAGESDGPNAVPAVDDPVAVGDARSGPERMGSTAEAVPAQGGPQSPAATEPTVSPADGQMVRSGQGHSGELAGERGADASGLSEEGSEGDSDEWGLSSGWTVPGGRSSWESLFEAESDRSDLRGSDFSLRLSDGSESGDIEGPDTAFYGAGAAADASRSASAEVVSPVASSAGATSDGSARPGEVTERSSGQSEEQDHAASEEGAGSAPEVGERPSTQSSTVGTADAGAEVIEERAGQDYRGELADEDGFSRPGSDESFRPSLSIDSSWGRNEMNEMAGGEPVAVVEEPAPSLVERFMGSVRAIWEMARSMGGRGLSWFGLFLGRVQDSLRRLVYSLRGLVYGQASNSSSGAPVGNVDGRAEESEFDRSDSGVSARPWNDPRESISSELSDDFFGRAGTALQFPQRSDASGVSEAGSEGDRDESESSSGWTVPGGRSRTESRESLFEAESDESFRPSLSIDSSWGRNEMAGVDGRASVSSDLSDAGEQAAVGNISLGRTGAEGADTGRMPAAEDALPAAGRTTPATESLEPADPDAEERAGSTAEAVPAQGRSEFDAPWAEFDGSDSGESEWSELGDDDVDALENARAEVRDHMRRWDGAPGGLGDAVEIDGSDSDGASWTSDDSGESEWSELGDDDVDALENARAEVRDHMRRWDGAPGGLGDAVEIDGSDSDGASWTSDDSGESEWSELGDDDVDALENARAEVRDHMRRWDGAPGGLGDAVEIDGSDSDGASWTSDDSGESEWSELGDDDVDALENARVELRDHMRRRDGAPGWLGDAVEIARAVVEPDRTQGWVGSIGGRLDLRRFEARRYRLPAGDFGTRAVVRIFLDRADGAPVTEDQLGEVARRAQEGVEQRYNGGYRLPNGDLFRVDLEFVSAEDAHHTVTVHAEFERENHRNWALRTESDVLAHEVGHLLGLEDEYRENTKYGDRTVYPDESLMAGYNVDGRGRPLVDDDHDGADNDHVVEGAGLTRMRIAPRHLKQIGSAIEAALRTARLRSEGQVVFSTADGLRPRADGLPTRVHFSFDTRVAVLYGEPRAGGGGHLPPKGMSWRPRPVALEGTANPNGTYRAEYPGLRVRPELADRSRTVAGDLHVPQRQPQRGQMMFPAHWDEDHAVYAAEQAYLHALREDRVLPVEGRPGVYVWTGEYDGVRITGEFTIGPPRVRFFRPSDDQPDKPGPAHAAPPPPAVGSDTRPVFGRRVEDVVRYGDRRTRSGAYHEPKVDRAEQQSLFFYGLSISTVREHDNGTYEAGVWFLDPALRPRDDETVDPLRWHLHQDGDHHVMFPKEWTPDYLLDAVESAHVEAIAANRVRKVDDRGTYHWIGDAALESAHDGGIAANTVRKEDDRGTYHWVGYVEWIRVEGLVRDGHHVVYRPTQMQPYNTWPAVEPVGEAAGSPSATREGQVPAFAVRHVLFKNGQRGLDFVKRIHLVVPPGTDDNEVNEDWSDLETMVSEEYGRSARGPRADAALVRLSLARAASAEEAHHSFTAGDLGALMDNIMAVMPRARALHSLAGDLLDSAALTADAWRPPAGTDGVALQRALELLDLADPFSRPTTLREPDPADPGARFEDEPGPLDGSTDSAQPAEHQTEEGAAGPTPPGVRPAAGSDHGASPDMALAGNPARDSLDSLDSMDSLDSLDSMEGNEEAGEPANPDVLPVVSADWPTGSDSGADEDAPDATSAERAQDSGERELRPHRLADGSEPGEQEGAAEGARGQTAETSSTPRGQGGEQRSVIGPIESELNANRPPRIDLSMTSPSPAEGPVVYSDGSRMPDYLTTGYAAGETQGRSYGFSQVTLRGADMVVREIGERLGEDQGSAPGLPTALEHLRGALGTTPQVFHGDGYESPAFGHDRDQVLRVTTRPYGTSERFTDVQDDPPVLQANAASSVTTGATKAVSSGTQLSLGVNVGPPAAGVSARVGGTAGVTRSQRYVMRDQTAVKNERRSTEGAHLHLDDVWYEVSVVRPTPLESAVGGQSSSAPDEDMFGFAVRHGLAVRLPDSETASGEPGPGRRSAPSRIELGPQSDYRLVHTEGYGPVKDLRDRLLAEVGAAPGSPAYDQITGFFSADTFHRVADRLARGAVTTGLLSADDGSPLGAIVVERVVPGEARLLSESSAVELKHYIQQTVTNERAVSRTSSRGLSARVGGYFGLDSPAWGPLVTGIGGSLSRAATQGTVFGASGTRKIGGKYKDVPTALYRVSKTVTVRWAGSPEPIRFETWSLDRMLHTEARRLAGWPDGTTLRTRNGNEPFAPPYLTVDRPAVLGMSRPEAFTYDNGDLVRDGWRGWLEVVTDTVIRDAASLYPDLLAPLEDFGAPGSSGRWRDAQHYNLALQNTLAVMNVLSHHGMAGSLEALTTTGIRLDLMTRPSALLRPHLSLHISGQLTGRRYEGTQNDFTVRVSAPGTTRLDGSYGVTRAGGVGTDTSVRVNLAESSRHAVTVSAVPWYERAVERGGDHGSTVSHEPMAMSSKPSHLYSYALELTARIDGFSRYRRAVRASSLGVLGGPSFLHEEGGIASESLRGRVLLSVPDEHTPATDPQADLSGRPVSDVEPLEPARARALVTGEPYAPDDALTVPESHGQEVSGDEDLWQGRFGDHPYQTFSVGAHPELVRAAEDLMAELSGESWRFTRTGALPHDALVRHFQPHYLAAGFDQASVPAGSRLLLRAQGGLRDIEATVVHRMRLVGPLVVSKPDTIATDESHAMDLQTSASVSTTRSRSWALGVTAAHTLTGPDGTVLSTFYGLSYSRGGSRASTTAVSRKVTLEVGRSAAGHHVLITGNTQHELAGALRPVGALGPLLSPLYRNSWAGKRLTFTGDWLGHLPEKAVHELGLVQDGLGEVPRYTDRPWTQPNWLHDRPFGSYAANTLDAGKVLAAFDRQLRDWGVDETGRERLRDMISPRALGALREQMTSTGAVTRTRVGNRSWHGIRIGSRYGSLRLELIAGKPMFDRLDHGLTVWDVRVATMSETEATSAATSRGVNWGITQSTGTLSSVATPSPGDVTAVRAGLSGGVGHADRMSSSRSRTRQKEQSFSTTEPHAEFLTGYKLRLTLDLGNGETATTEGSVGSLREQVPLSLTVPDARPAAGGDPLGTPTPDTPARSVRLRAPGDVTQEAVDRWRSTARPDGTQAPFEPPAQGFQVRRVIGLENLREAGDLALAMAYGMPVSRVNGVAHELTGLALDAALGDARRTALTRPGTVSALALDEGISDAALAAFYAESAAADGYRVVGLNDDTSTNWAHGHYRIHSKPDFSRATLLTVFPDSSMFADEGDATSTGAALSYAASQGVTTTLQPVVSAGQAVSAVPAVSGTGPASGEADEHAVSAARSGATGTERSGRTFLFAIPTGWLGVAEVERWMAFGRVRPLPQGAHADTVLIALVSEDVAREWGLVDDGNFPPRVADAWADVSKAGNAWVAADDAYWKKRREVAELPEEAPELKSTVLQPLLDRAEAAAGEFHRVRAAADRLTRWHRLPAEAHRPGEPELRAGLPEPLAVEFTVADGEVKAGHLVYEVRDGVAGDPGLLVSPEGDQSYTLYEVPEDGDGFFHALAEGLHHVDPGLLAQRVDVTDRQEMVGGLRRLLADELSDPENAGLLDFTSPDTGDEFGVEELQAGGVTSENTVRLSGLKPATMGLSRSERREFAESGHIPLHVKLPERQRAGLAREQLLRGGDAADKTHWDHGAADLLPALAARHFGAWVTVVGADGRFQDFRPPLSEAGDPGQEQLPHVVLYLSDRHYRPALPSGDARRQPALPEAPPRTPEAGREADAAVSGTPQNRAQRPAYAVAPWAAGTGGWGTTRVGDKTRLIGPDGTAHTIREPQEAGNGFWSAVFTGLRPQGVTERALLTRALAEGVWLDRGTPFTDEELARAGLSEETIESVRRRRADGGLAQDLELTEQQEKALGDQLFTDRGWNEATERTAVAQVASYGVNVTVVGEDGTSSSNRAPGEGSLRPELVLYRRGREYLLAEPVADDDGPGTSPTDAETLPPLRTDTQVIEVRPEEESTLDQATPASAANAPGPADHAPPAVAEGTQAGEPAETDPTTVVDSGVTGDELDGGDTATDPGDGAAHWRDIADVFLPSRAPGDVPRRSPAEGASAGPDRHEKLEQLLDSPAVLDTRVGREHVQGLPYSPSAAATWVLAPDTELPLRDTLRREDRASVLDVLDRHPELFPVKVRESLARLTGEEEGGLLPE